MPNIEGYTIDSEDEADDYLKDLLSKPEYRRDDEVLLRAQAHVPDACIRVYFIDKGREMLKAYGVGVAYEAVELKDGSGWYVRVTPQAYAPTRQVTGFASEADARAWIDQQ
jgi:predicted methyltransferase